ncbi:MAG: YraN family protein [Prevotella sp.]|jgi:putative endonuclease|nr:YraN family protein [Prevotella sp.]MCI1282687.1 YraN family protein [Prevotella sp.]
MAEHNELGKWGEDLAAKYLVSHGYYIRDRDWKSGKRDLDIVALNEAQNLLVFVEVKTRKDDNLANPEAAVDQKKILNLGRAANDYICQFALDYEVRFDILTVIGTNEADAKIDHFEDAFNPLLAL